MKVTRKYDHSPEYLNLLLENAREGIFAIDMQFNITYRNARAAEIHGMPAEVPPEEWSEYMRVLDADGVTPTPQDQLPVMMALQGKVVRNQFHYVWRKNLPMILVKYSATPIIENGKQIGVVISTEEATELAESLARFKAIFEQSPFSIQIVSKTGKTLLVNKAFVELWGFPQEFLNDFILNTYNILEDEILRKSGHLDLIKKAFLGEAVSVPPIYYDPASQNLPGRPRWAQAIFYPLKDITGSVIEVVIIHTDVTDQKLAESDKEKLFSQLETIMKQMPAGLMVSNLKGEIGLYNEQMHKIIGDPDKAKQVFDKTIKRSLSGETVHAEIKVKNNDNTTSVFAANAGPVHNSEGKILSSVLIVSDNTEEKRSETNAAFLTHVKSLLISTLDFDQILDKIANAAIPYLADGCMVDILEEDGIKRILTLHSDPEIQKFMNELVEQFPPTFDSPQPTARAIRTGFPELMKIVDTDKIRMNTFNEKHAKLIEKIGITSHIAVPLLIRGSVIGAFNFFVGKDRPSYDEKDFVVAQELGRHAALAIDNTRLYGDARSAVQIRDEFISIASHELRTPITSLNLQIEVLSNLVEGIASEGETHKLMKKFVGNTHVQLRRLTRLVDDMLDISRITTGKLTLNIRPVNVTHLAQDVLDRFKDQLKSHDIDHDFESQGDISVACDAERIDQVITNFMTNAIRYGGKKPIHVIVCEDKDFAYIKVRDEGRGISKSDQERIFKRFERAHTQDDVSGLGLGLFINQQIVEEHKGRITIESEPGQGSTFCVELPKLRP